MKSSLAFFPCFCRRARSAATADCNESISMVNPLTTGTPDTFSPSWYSARVDSAVMSHGGSGIPRWEKYPGTRFNPENS